MLWYRSVGVYFLSASEEPDSCPRQSEEEEQNQRSAQKEQLAEELHSFTEASCNPDAYRKDNYQEQKRKADKKHHAPESRAAITFVVRHDYLPFMVIVVGVLFATFLFIIVRGERAS